MSLGTEGLVLLAAVVLLLAVLLELVAAATDPPRIVGRALVRALSLAAVVSVIVVLGRRLLSWALGG